MQSDITSVAAVLVQLSTDRLSYVVIRGGKVFRGDLNLGEKCTAHIIIADEVHLNLI